MKKRYIWHIVLLAFYVMLYGCTSEKTVSSDTEQTSIFQTDSLESTSQEVCTTIAENIDISFAGLNDVGETPYICNSVSCLNQNGLLYNGDELIYSDSNGNLMRDDTIICSNVSPKGINILNDTIYFINGNDNKVYSIDFNGTNLNVFLDVEALMFVKTDKYSLVEDSDHILYIITESSTKLISDKMVTWVDIYGKYVIYCEFGNKCQVNAYDTDNGTITKLLDYGFSPTVHKDMLYYQEKNNGYICGLDLNSGKISTIIEKWGQQFSFVDDELYYTDSRGIHSAENGDIYIPDGNSEIQAMFDSGNELFFTEYIKQTDTSKIYKLDIQNGERILIK